MATAQTWRKTRTPNVYVRESKTSATGKLWKVYYLGPLDTETGKRRQLTKTLTREAEARVFLKQVTHQKITGSLTDPKAGRRPLRELYDEVHQVRKYAPATAALHGYVWNAVTPLHDSPIADIDGATISKVLSKIEAPTMREKAWSLLSTLFKYAMTDPKSWGVVTNPAIKPSRKKTRAEKLEEGSNGTNGKRYLGRDELLSLLSELPDRYRALVALMCSMGLRPGEAVALRVGKFDPAKRTLLIDTSLTGFTKTGEPRTLVLPAVVGEMLTEHLARFSDPTDPEAPMFPKENGSAIDSKFSYDAWSRRHFREAARRAGIEGDLTPNSCRHTAVAFAIGNGANVYDVQRMVGHAKPSITLDVYGGLWDESPERLATRQDKALRDAWGRHFGWSVPHGRATG